MTLLELIRSLEPDQLTSIAARSGTTVGNLRQIAHGFRRAGPALAINLDRESENRVSFEELRPDVDWAYVKSSRRHCGDRTQISDQVGRNISSENNQDLQQITDSKSAA